MKISRLQITILLFISLSHPCIAQDLPIFLPPPQVPPLPDSLLKEDLLHTGSSPGGSQGNRRKLDPPKPPTVAILQISDDLEGYELGKATHPEELSFSAQVARLIIQQITAGNRLDRVTITGFADGYPNDGIRYEWHTLPMKCQDHDNQLVDDSRLAFLRSCVIHHHISEALGAKYSGLVSWKQDSFDEPDGGRIGSNFRKTHVDIYLKKQEK